MSEKGAGTASVTKKWLPQSDRRNDQRTSKVVCHGFGLALAVVLAVIVAPRRCLMLSHEKLMLAESWALLTLQDLTTEKSL